MSPFRTFLLRRVASLTLVLTFAAALAMPADAANFGWVRGTIRLNLRAGAGTEFKILGVVKTGDELKVLNSSDSWTLVETKDGKNGWIPAGFLETEPPPTIRLEMLESETATLRTELKNVRSEADRLREANTTLETTDTDQREEVEALRIDNFELRAGRRYQEWITGALILSLGMLLGAYLHRNSTRRPSSRIRL